MNWRAFFGGVILWTSVVVVIQFALEESSPGTSESVETVTFTWDAAEVDYWRVWYRGQFERDWQATDVTEPKWVHFFSPGVWEIQVQAFRDGVEGAKSNVLGFVVSELGFQAPDFTVKYEL